MTQPRINPDWHLSEELTRQAERNPDSRFIQMVDGPVCSFGEFDQQVSRIAGGLAALGVEAHERVAIMGGNSIEFLETLVAITRIGAVAVPVNLAYKGAFLEHILNNSGAKILCIDPEFAPIVGESAENLPGITTTILMPGGDKAVTDEKLPGSEALNFTELIDGPQAAFDYPGSVRDVAALMYTSGTTGPSKGVYQPHGHILLQGRVFADQMRLNQDDVLYCCLPMFHANALGLHFSAALQLGCELVIDDRFHATRWIDTIRHYHATQTNLLGVMTDFVYQQPPSPSDADNDLRVICCLPIPATSGPAFEKRFGARLIELYGTTEVNVPLYMPYDEGLRPGAAGKVVEDWFEVMIADPETDEPVPTETIGEILVRPKAPWCFMAGYHGNPEATVSAWQNFWFHTGDAGKKDADGYFYFVDRMRDCLRRRGENISSFEAEAVIAEHTDIKEVAVVGIDSGIEGGEQEVMACIVLTDDACRKPRENVFIDLLDHCNRRMPKFAVPRFVRTVESLPKTPTEKVQKKVLRDQGLTDDTWDRERSG